MSQNSLVYFGVKSLPSNSYNKLPAKLILLFFNVSTKSKVACQYSFSWNKFISGVIVKCLHLSISINLSINLGVKYSG